MVDGGGFSPVDKGNFPKTKKADRDAIKKLLTAESTKCHYTRFGDMMSVLDEYTPQIIDVPHPCPTPQQKYKPACVGTVYCSNPLINFMVSNTVCWAKSDTRCPSAKKCAESSQLVYFGNREGLIGYSIFFDRKYPQTEKSKK